jgi:hypothetical protein
LLVRQCGNGGFEFGCIVNRCPDRLHCERGNGAFERVQIIFGIRRREKRRKLMEASARYCELNFPGKVLKFKSRT